MKILILSDIHGNFDALEALSESCDEIWVLGDLVNYGPQPREVVEIIRKRASIVVQGNHDHAVGHEDDSRWSARFRPVAEASRRFSSSALSEDQRRYLRDLPVSAEAVRDGARFHLVHATPSDPHYGRLTPDASEWIGEIENLAADVLLVGHSHVPFIRRIGSKTLVNPGSLGQPRAGEPRASYAIWTDGRLELRSFAYPIETTVAKIRAIGFPPDVEQELAAILRRAIA